ncbi:MAG TPA: acyltransferase [Dehalococcoidia bacterium]|nr:acyltransferase [Dehalococcoidia bacterium]
MDHGKHAGEGRIVAIDLLRGIAILWVILFHLWGDLEFFPAVPRAYYEQLTWQVKHGEGPWRIFTSCTDLLFRDGFQGVPLFMMISGISLTIAAYRAGGAPNWPRFFVQRFRKLLLPYWAGVAITYAVIALIAWRQATIGGGSFTSHLGDGVTISLGSRVNVDPGVIYASIALVPRLLHDQWFFAPQLALWFVGLLAQYYLLFPLLFFVMRRIGVVPFLVLTFATTVMANWWIVDRFGAPEFQFRLVTGWAPFRLFEFTAGMAIGWLLAAPEGARALRVLRSPSVIASLLLLGFAAHTTGDLLIGRWSVRYWQSLATPLMTLGLAMLVLPLLLKRPSRLDLSAPVRGLATIGVMSYALLIVNDPMRLVASQLRLEHVAPDVWWAFLAAVYVPASIALAWPLARVLGLMPAPAAGAVRAPRRHDVVAAASDALEPVAP